MSDPSYWDQCDALVETAYGWAGKVNVLVNNAGLSPLYPSVDVVTESLWDKVLAINLKGPYAAAKAELNAMTAGGSA